MYSNTGLPQTFDLFKKKNFFQSTIKQGYAFNSVHKIWIECYEKKVFKIYVFQQVILIYFGGGRTSSRNFSKKGKAKRHKENTKQGQDTDDQSNPISNIHRKIWSYIPKF